MVSTRHHPRPFPPPPETPTSTTISARPTPDSPSSPTATSASPPPTTRSRSHKRKSTSGTTTKATDQQDEEDTKTPYKTSDLKSALSTRSKSKTRTQSVTASRKRTKDLYTHTPPPFLIPWLLLSLPLVVWDTMYILGRPHTMPGGSWHRPIWSPYELYGRIDYIYGSPAWDEKNGFTAAQGTLNAFETAFYIYYLYVVGKRVAGGDGFLRGVALRSWDVFSFSRHDERTKKAKVVVRGGSDVAGAVVLLFATMALTSAKTVLYALNEHYSGYKHVRHNFGEPLRLFVLWIVPNTPWIFIPAVFAWILGKEIVEAMTTEKGGRLGKTEEK